MVDEVHMAKADALTNLLTGVMSHYSYVGD